MLSRVASNVYWMSRYMERAENVARFIDVNLHLTLDLPMEHANQWHPLVTVTGDEERFAERFGDPTKENVIEFLTFDPENPNSIFSCFRKARENARTVREVISSELWRKANEMYLFMNAPSARKGALDRPYEFFQYIREGCTLFKGLSDATMTHGESWQFIRLGRMTERADKTSRIVDVKYFILLPELNYVGTPYDNIQWAAVLKSASALEMYRIEHHRITPSSVTEFLVLSRYFPRAMHFCVATAETAMHAITGTPPGTYSNPAERQLGRLCSELEFADIKEILETGLHEYIDAFQVKLNAVGGAITETFFGYMPGEEPAQSQTQSQVQV